MSYAPPELLDLQRYLINRFDLPHDQVGIVGNPVTHKNGYHLGWDMLASNDGWGDYSARLPRDRKALQGPTRDAACALDVTNKLPDNSAFLSALLADCRAGAAYTLRLRAIDCTLDGVTAHRFDRESGFRAEVADDSHLWHNHFEWYRDTIADGLSQIQIVSQFYGGGEFMPKLDKIKVPAGISIPGIAVGALVDPEWLWLANYQHTLNAETQAVKGNAADAVRDTALGQAIAELAAVIKAGGGSVDSAVILAGVNAAVDRVMPGVEAKVDAELSRIAAAFTVAAD